LNRDYTVAADWYRKAADQSHPLATYELAELYYRGRGVEKDRVRALEFYERAAALDVKAAEARVDRLKR
jgi:TPR repeat protein